MLLEALVADPGFDLTLLVAPPAGEDVVVRWVHTSDILDPRPWLEGGELLLTTGSDLPTSPQGVAAYVRRLQGAGVAALGFGVRPYHRDVPAALRRACGRWRLPLVEVPSSTPFIAVSRAVGQWWSEQQNRDIGSAMAAQRRLARAALDPVPLTALVERLAAELGCWVVVRRPHGDAVAGTVPQAVEARLASLVENAGATSSTEVEGESVLVRRLPGWAGAALVVGRPRRLSSMERAVLLVAEDLVAVTLSDQPRHVDRDAVSGLALRALEEGDAELGHELVRALGVSGGPEEGWRVVVAQSRQGAPPADLPSRLASHRRVVVTGGPSSWTVLTAEESFGSVVDELVAAGLVCGYSSVTPDELLPRAFPEARGALAVASTVGRGAVGAADLRGRGPLSAVTEGQVEAARLYLDPLLRDARAELLVATARTWLDTNGHWDRAAQRLGVHRHTVKSRVARAFALLGGAPDSPRDRFELWFALQSVGPSPTR